MFRFTTCILVRQKQSFIQLTILNFPYLGLLNSETVEKIEDGVDGLRLNCRNFCIEMMQQIKKRYVFYDDFFKIVQLVQTRNASCMNPLQLRQVLKRFPILKNQCNSSVAQTEWRAHSLISLDELDYSLVIDEPNK